MVLSCPLRILAFPITRDHPITRSPDPRSPDGPNLAGWSGDHPIAAEDCGSRRDFVAQPPSAVSSSVVDPHSSCRRHPSPRPFISINPESKRLTPLNPWGPRQARCWLAGWKPGVDCGGLCGTAGPAAEPCCAFAGLKSGVVGLGLCGTGTPACAGCAVLAQPFWLCSPDSSAPSAYFAVTPRSFFNLRSSAFICGRLGFRSRPFVPFVVKYVFLSRFVRASVACVFVFPGWPGAKG